LKTQLKKTYNVRFSEDLITWLDDYAASKEKKVSELIREAVVDYKEKKVSQAQKKKAATMAA
jgi:Arc/MetJ-type ribon-helix-helix transcriptional regulator